ncbi:Nucleoside triphosphate pyrophosphohydrolase [Nitrospira japonica]|uniref:Nucleoside triphosphate pyrophosphohydrolase n=1 Tax=Nitrospira japonica TaxID=1325564 RepID=A0A1W1I668_9BACT|nr:nucleoside triphosphate pyrophosphohydrolase [Nitrospira japonica]SLM48369.1 Nucleoside triphosphate pyrophosphohydrolase [Nitrospira japonica]
MSTRFDKLAQLMAALRAPNGCPWDRKQTHESLKPYLLEESYEVLDAIDHQDRAKLSEELGDVLLQVLFHGQIASENGAFTLDDVLDRLADKLIRRHPHVFAPGTNETTPLNSDQVLTRWEDIKKAERRAAGRPDSVLDGIPAALPALLRAYQIQARASRVGFDWSHDQGGFEQVLAKVEEEIRELQEAFRLPETDEASSTRQRDIVAELGDVLFSLVNLSRFMKVNPEDALRLSVNRFVERFRFIEREASRTGRSVGELSFDEMNNLWEAAKRGGSAHAQDDPA